MQRLQIDTYRTEIPASMNELTGDQLLFAARIAAAGESEETMKLKCAFYFAKLKLGNETATAILPDDTVIKFGSLDLWFLCESVNFLFDKTSPQNHLFLQKLPEIQVKDETWAGPMDALGNITWEEFILTQREYGRFLISKDERHIFRLAAILYRPLSGIQKTDPEFNGDLRERVNDFLTDERADILLENEPPEFFLAVLWFYAGSLEFINLEFPGVLSDPKNDKPEKEPTGTAAAPNIDPFDAMMELTDVLCNEDVTSVEKVRQSNLYDVVRRLKNAKAKQKAQRELADKMKKK